MDTPITTQDLLDLLPIVAREDWEIFLDSSIRNTERRCPLCALAHEIDPSIDYREMACAAFLELGFSEIKNPSLKEIMDAADFPDQPLRPALMQALGMVK